jgi:hypothetical protein
VGTPFLLKSTVKNTQVTGIENSEKLPESYDMLRNYPNPVNPSTTIRFELKTSQRVRLRVFDLLGKELETLVDGRLSEGIHEMKWDAQHRAAGIYFCRLETEDSRKTIKMLLQR